MHKQLCADKDVLLRNMKRMRIHVHSMFVRVSDADAHNARAQTHHVTESANMSPYYSWL